MATQADIEVLLGASNCYKCIPRGMTDGVMIMLLNTATGLNLTPAQLVEAAKCYKCIPPGMRQEVLTYLMAQTGCQNDAVDDWVERVATNGGTTPTISQKATLCHFCDGLDAAGLTDKVISMCCLVPGASSPATAAGDLVRALTPLFVGGGNDPWTNVGPFVPGDLTQDGLVGDGLAKYLNTGIIPSTVFTSDNDVCLAIYNLTVDNSAMIEIGCTGTDTVDQCRLQVSSGASSSILVSWNFAQRLIMSNPNWAGFLIGFRDSVHATAIMRRGNSVVGFGSGITSGGALTDDRPDTELYAYATNNNGTAASYSSRRLSFVAILHSITLPEAETFFNLVQSMRVGLGGGYV